MTDLDTNTPTEANVARPMAAWWPLAGSVALVALAYVGDWALRSVLEGLLSNPEAAPAAPNVTPWVLLSMASRVLAIALAFALGWLVLRSPRRPPFGLAMLAVGLYFPVATELYRQTYNAATPVLLPLLPAAPALYDLVTWMSTAVIVLGAITVIRPASEGTDADR